MDHALRRLLYELFLEPFVRQLRRRSEPVPLERRGEDTSMAGGTYQESSASGGGNRPRELLKNDGYL